MLFCFGLFALLLYYTVVANAECSYTYRNSSQHIEAHSLDYEKQGFQRCEFLIQASGQHGIELNFTRITGFGPPSSQHEDSAEEEEASGRAEEGGDGPAQGTDQSLGRGRGGGVDSARGGGGGGGGGGGDGEGRAAGGGGSSSSGSSRGSLHDVESSVRASHGPRLGASASSTPRSASGRGSKLSPILSSPTPPARVSSTVFVQSETLVGLEVPTTTASFSADKVQPTPLPGQASTTRRPCLPIVEIREVLGEGHEKTRHVICRQRHYKTPVVFHYASSVRIVYEWEEKRNSGFTLYFDFSKEKCVLKCDGEQCLHDSQLLCDGHYDCQDKSDELHPSCNKQLQPPEAATGQLDAGSLVKIIVIPTCLVVLIVLSIVCLLGRHHCHVLSRTMHHRSNSHAGHLTCPSSHSSEGLTPSAGSTQECSEQAVALLPSGHSHKTWGAGGQRHSPPPPPRDAEIGLPPNIPVSPDGEEGYVASQLRLLHPRYCMVQSELFKAPPNKTVFDRESPPPYSLSPSQKSFGCSSAPPIPSLAEFGSEGFVPGHLRVVRDSEGQPVVSRCYTMFTQSTRGSGGSAGGGGGGGGGGSRSRINGVARDSGSSPCHRHQDIYTQQKHQQQQQQCHQQRQQPRPRPPPPLSPPSRGAYSVVNNVLRPTPLPALTPVPTPAPTPTPTPNPSPLLVGSSVSGVQTCDSPHQASPAGQSLSSSRAVSRDSLGSANGAGGRAVRVGRARERAARGSAGSVDAIQGNSCDSRGSPPDYDLACSDGARAAGGPGPAAALGSDLQQGSVSGSGRGDDGGGNVC